MRVRSSLSLFRSVSSARFRSSMSSAEAIVLNDLPMWHHAKVPLLFDATGTLHLHVASGIAGCMALQLRLPGRMPSRSPLDHQDE